MQKPNSRSERGEVVENRLVVRMFEENLQAGEESGSALCFLLDPESGFSVEGNSETIVGSFDAHENLCNPGFVSVRGCVPRQRQAGASFWPDFSWGVGGGQPKKGVTGALVFTLVVFFSVTDHWDGRKQERSEQKCGKMRRCGWGGVWIDERTDHICDFLAGTGLVSSFLRKA